MVNVIVIILVAAMWITLISLCIGYVIYTLKDHPHND